MLILFHEQFFIFVTVSKDRAVLNFFQWGKIQEFLDQIDMGEQHSSTAVSFQSESIQCITFGVFGLNKNENNGQLTNNLIPVITKDKLPTYFHKLFHM